MAEYDNTNRGVLFAEAQKESDNHPDYTGKLNVGGKEFYLAGWKKKSKAGKPFLSLSIKPATGRKDREDDNPPF
jgi:uncharacterized protein (DUF736 family)